MNISLDFQGRFLRRLCIRNGMVKWHGMKGTCINPWPSPWLLRYRGGDGGCTYLETHLKTMYQYFSPLSYLNFKWIDVTWQRWKAVNIVVRAMEARQHTLVFRRIVISNLGSTLNKELSIIHPHMYDSVYRPGMTSLLSINNVWRYLHHHRWQQPW